VLWISKTKHVVLVDVERLKILKQVHSSSEDFTDPKAEAPALGLLGILSICSDRLSINPGK
jgi:hypothetical protein